jgi:hypothetical protein
MRREVEILEQVRSIFRLIIIAGRTFEWEHNHASFVCDSKGGKQISDRSLTRRQFG